MDSSFYSHTWHVNEGFPQEADENNLFHSLNPNAGNDILFDQQNIFSSRKEYVSSGEMDVFNSLLLKQLKDDQRTLSTQSCISLPSTSDSSGQSSQMSSPQVKTQEVLGKRKRPSEPDFPALDFKNSGIKFNMYKVLAEKRSQNKMKNHQGTISGKVKKLCQKDKNTKEDTEIFKEATKSLDANQKEKFRAWALGYGKQGKTWASLERFFNTNLSFAMVFVRMVLLFLSKRFKDVYEESLSQGQMSEETQNLLKEESSKMFYVSKFTLAIRKLQGKVKNYTSAIKSSKKSLKV